MKKVKVSLRPVASKINLPTVLKTTTLPKESYESLFIATQVGEIFKINNSNRLEKFLDIKDRIIALGSNGGYDERGLLGLAFHPRFSNNGLFYLHYSVTDSQGPGALDYKYIPNPCDNSSLNLKWENRDELYDHIDTIEEWALDSNGNKSKRRTLINLRRPFMNHNGVNSLNFCPETNRLIFTNGDGGSGYDPFNLSQDDLEIAGKAICIDIDKNLYIENPPIVTRFNELPRPLQEIMELIIKGIRNTSGISFGNINNQYTKYIGNVGQELVESIYAFDVHTKIPITKLTDNHSNANNIINLGWRAWEGNFPTPVLRECDNDEKITRYEIAYYNQAVELSSKYIYPLTCYYQYDLRKDKFEGNALTGVQVYNGKTIPDLNGKIIFIDYMNSDPNSNRGILGYTNPRENYKLNDFSEIDIEYDFKNQTSFFTCLGVNMNQTKIYLGVYGSSNISDLNQGTIFEIIPKQ